MLNIEVNDIKFRKNIYIEYKNHKYSDQVELRIDSFSLSYLKLLLLKFLSVNFFLFPPNSVRFVFFALF